MAGLVVITPGAGFVSPTGAVLIGVLAGVVPFFACTKLKNMFNYDDALDTFGVHGVGGTMGALLTGFFATSDVNPNLNNKLSDIVGKTLWIEQLKAMGFTRGAGHRRHGRPRVRRQGGHRSPAGEGRRRDGTRRCRSRRVGVPLRRSGRLIRTENFETEEALMKLIMAIIRPHKLEEVKKALTEVGVFGMSVSEIRGFGRTGGKTEVYRGSAYQLDFVPKIRIDLVVVDNQVQAILEALEQSAKTGKIGDGKVFVLNVEEAVRLRTGERGEIAI